MLPRDRAADVVSSWRAHEATVRELGIESVVVSDSNLVVTLSQPSDSAPRLFADPALAVPHAPSNLAPDSDLSVVQSDGLPAAVIRFRVEPNSDPRDLLDRGADLVVTRDPAVVDYVSNRAEFATFPLPWSRTYLLVWSGAQPGELAVDLSALPLRSSLARDAVRASARAAEPPFWWTARIQCRDSSTIRPGRTSPRVVYRRDDDVARRLAERIVALAHTGSALRAVGLETEVFAKAVEGASDRAYVVGVPRQEFVPCRDAFRSLVGAQLLPLIDTRAYAIVRKGAPPLTVDWDGTVRVVER